MNCHPERSEFIRVANELMQSKDRYESIVRMPCISG